MRALHGLSRTLLANMVTGVKDGFTKSLELQGVGYRVAKVGENLVFSGRLLAPGAGDSARPASPLPSRATPG